MHRPRVVRSLASLARARRYRRGVVTLALAAAVAVAAASSPSALVQSLPLTDPLVGAALRLAGGAPARAGAEAASERARAEPVRVRVEVERAVQVLDARFLSVAIDTSQLVGGRWWSPSGRVEVGRGARRVAPFDFARPGLLPLARALSPAYLRVGGTEADHVYYAMDPGGGALPPGHELVLEARTWDALAEFSSAAGFDLVFTLNAGPGPRAGGEAWQPENAEALLRHAREAGHRVAVWELGNEVNGYWFIHGLSHQIDGARYAADLGRLSQLVARHHPGSRIAGPGSSIWPGLGEPFAFAAGILEDFLGRGASPIDIITWHYYPQQSRRCPLATRRASLERLLEPAHLDEVGRWAAHVSALRERHAPHAEVWLGETGNAQCGGEPGVSDRFVAGLWWLDQLGLLARSGQQAVVRQTLIGSDYGLLDQRTLRPNPDYHNSLLWKRLMGSAVLEVSRRGAEPHLRLYAHCAARGAPGDIALLALNTHPRRPARFRLEEAPPSALRHALTAPRLDSRELYLEGERLEAAGGAPPPLRGRRVQLGDGLLELAPASYAFWLLEGMRAPACLGRGL